MKILCQCCDGAFTARAYNPTGEARFACAKPDCQEKARAYGALLADLFSAVTDGEKRALRKKIDELQMRGVEVIRAPALSAAPKRAKKEKKR